MKPTSALSISDSRGANGLSGHGLPLPNRTARACVVTLLAVFAAAALAQSPAVPSPAQPPTPSAQPDTTTTAAAPEPRNADRRRAAKLYLAAIKLYMGERFEDALKSYDEAATLDPTNRNYRLAAGVARAHAVSALIQAAAKDRLRGDEAGARAALTHALELDPKNAEATQHLYELGDDAARAQPEQLRALVPSEQALQNLGDVVQLEPEAGLHSFHLRTDKRQMIQQVYKTYGVTAMLDDSIEATPVRLDLDDAGFDTAAHAVGLITHSFYVALDEHRAVVADDTTANRAKYTRMATETVYLSGLKPEEMTEVGNVAKQVFDVKQVQIEASSNTITLRAPRDTLDAFNSTIHQLIDGHNQVLVDIKLIQIAHTASRDTGMQPPQTFTAFNVYAEEQSILNQNASLVQQIISSGLAAPGDTLAILGILLASGQVSSSIFSNGVALFGGGLTQSALSPGPVTANFSLNSSDSRELDDMQLRLGDGETGTLKEGERYPIQTSSFSSLSASVPSIPGLNSAGASGSLSSILSQLEGSVPSVPQVEYQDLGLTLKTTANVLRSDQVALTIDLKITALSGSSINGNPILNSRSYSGVVTVKQDTAVVLASEIDKSESRDISGTPGLSEIPGMNNLTDKDAQKNYATLLVIITPHVVRSTQGGGQTTMRRVDIPASAQ